MTSSPTDPLLGQVIDDRYEIDDRVARGGMATVYRARDRRLDRPVALKIMHPHLAESADFVARFRREARAAARLSHRNVVAVHDQGTWQGAGYLVMEHVPGPNLRQVLRRRGSLPLGEALDVLDEVLAALGSAHRAGLVHRDIKPENVLLEPDGTEGGATAKVTDFGLARAVTEATAASTGTVLGTVAYLAPEIITHGTADPRADVYAVGILLFEAVVGMAPLEGESPIQIAYQHVHGEIPAPSELVAWLPQEVDELVAALTARDPLERPQDADAARTLLRRCRAQLDAGTLARRAEVVAPHPDPEPTPQWDDDTETARRTPAADADDEHGREPSADPYGTAAMPGMRTAVLDVARARGARPGDDPGAGRASRDTTASALGRGSVAVGPGPADEVLAVPIGTIEDRETVRRRHRHRRGRALLALLLLLLATAAAAAWWFLLGPGAQRTVPEVAGATRVEAETALRGADLSPHVAQENSDDVPAGTVIGTDPAAGATVRRGSDVAVRLSAGVLELPVPDVVGRSGESAEAAVRGAGFSDVTVTPTWSDEVPAGTTIAVTPGPGTTVDHRTPVAITVSRGPEPVEVPDVVGETQGDALALLTEAGLSGTVTRTQNDDTVPRGAVVSQSPRPEARAHRGDTVELVVSEGPVMVEVPDVVGLQRGEARRVLEAAGFTVREEEVLGAFFGTVRSQEPASGTAAPRGSGVLLRIV